MLVRKSSIVFAVGSAVLLLAPACSRSAGARPEEFSAAVLPAALCPEIGCISAFAIDPNGRLVVHADGAEDFSVDAYACDDARCRRVGPVNNLVGFDAPTFEPPGRLLARHRASGELFFVEYSPNGASVAPAVGTWQPVPPTKD